MECAAHVHLALDVHHVAFPQPHRGGDARRFRKLEVAEPQHRQAVDLTHAGAGRVDAEDIAQDRVVDFVAQPIGTPHTGRDGALDFGPVRDRLPRGPRPVVRLSQKIGKILHMRREFFAVLARARAVVDDAGHRAPVERKQSVAPAYRGGDAGIEVGSLRAPRETVGEVDLHLEQLAEVGIVFVQQVVEQPVAEQHDLRFERDGLRLDRYDRHRTRTLGGSMRISPLRRQRFSASHA